MSTDLYRVRVLSLAPEQRKVTFRVILVYSGWEGVPTDPSFFFRILLDEADRRFGGGGPLGDEVSLDQALDESWVDQNTARFVERVTRTALRNHPPPAVRKQPASGATDEATLTQGDYEVVVTDARWLEHLKDGMSWQTTSYETRAVMPAGRATTLLGAPPPAAAGAKRGGATPPAAKKRAAAKKPAAKAAHPKRTSTKKPRTSAKKPAAKAKPPSAKKPGAKKARPAKKTARRKSPA